MERGYRHIFGSHAELWLCVARRYLWWIVIPTSLAMMIVLGANRLAFRQYRAECLLVRQRDLVLNNLLKIRKVYEFDVSFDDGALWEGLAGELAVDALIKKLRQMGYGSTSGAARTTDLEDLRVRVPRELVIDTPASLLGLEYIRLSFADRDAGLARDIVNILAENYTHESPAQIDPALQSRYTRYDQQAEHYRGLIDQLEDRMTRFEVKHREALTATGAMVSKLRTEAEQLSARLENEGARSEAIQDQIKSVSNRTAEPKVVVVRNPERVELEHQLARLKLKTKVELSTWTNAYLRTSYVADRVKAIEQKLEVTPEWIVPDGDVTDIDPVLMSQLFPPSASWFGVAHRAPSIISGDVPPSPPIAERKTKRASPERPTTGPSLAWFGLAQPAERQPADSEHAKQAAARQPQRTANNSSPTPKTRATWFGVIADSLNPSQLHSGMGVASKQPTDRDPAWYELSLKLLKSKVIQVNLAWQMRRISTQTGSHAHYLPRLLEHRQLRGQIRSARNNLGYFESLLPMVRAKILGQLGSNGSSIRLDTPCRQTTRVTPKHTPYIHLCIAFIVLTICCWYAFQTVAHDPSVSDGRELAGYMGVPLIGFASEIISKKHQERRRLRRMIAAPIKLLFIVFFCINITTMSYAVCQQVITGSSESLRVQRLSEQINQRDQYDLPPPESVMGQPRSGHTNGRDTFGEHGWRW
jgi:hypothetical protein